jgi:hypothetical protein
MTLLDLRGTIARLNGTERFVIERRGKGQIVKGRHLEARAKQIQATGAVQQAEPKAMDMLPEGTRQDETLSVWTTTRVRTARADSHDADILQIRGDRYEVLNVADWSREGGYYQATVVKVGQ